MMEMVLDVDTIISEVKTIRDEYQNTNKKSKNYSERGEDTDTCCSLY